LLSRYSSTHLFNRSKKSNGFSATIFPSSSIKPFLRSKMACGVCSVLTITILPELSMGTKLTFFENRQQSFFNS